MKYTSFWIVETNLIVEYLLAIHWGLQILFLMLNWERR